MRPTDTWSFPIDFAFNQSLNDQTPLLIGEYGGKVGLSELPPAQESWDEWFTSVQAADWDVFRRYARDAMNRATSYLADLSVDDLQQPVEVAPQLGGEWKVIDVYTLHGWSHVQMHGGEIACLKGLQSSHGYLPFDSKYRDQ